MKHDDYNTVAVNEDFIIKPVDGFGNRDLIRQLLASERPDVMLLFTDPRFFIWLWEMEDEVHQMCPIAYWHLWDNPPWPEFNRVLYESTDLINCINYPTYEMVHERFPDRTNFVPHAVPKEIYFPLPKEDKRSHRANLLGLNHVDDFIAIWVSRNARRKMPSDVVLSWKMFLDQMEKKVGHRKATLIMHTDPNDMEGPNLHHVLEVTGMKDSVVFSKERLGFQEMNILYNISDIVLSRSANEGFGLSILESLYTGTPAVILKTGGMTRQVLDHRTGEQYGVALDPDVRSLVGNQHIPYIFEDFVSHEHFADAIMKMYDLGPDGRAELGSRGRAYAHQEFNLEKMVGDWDQSLTKLVEDWKKNGRSRWNMRTL